MWAALLFFLDTFHSFLFVSFRFSDEIRMDEVLWYMAWHLLAYIILVYRNNIYIYLIHVETYNDNRFGMGICLFLCRVIEPTQTSRTQRTMLLMARKIKKNKNVRGSVPNRLSPPPTPTPFAVTSLPSLDPFPIASLRPTDQRNKKEKENNRIVGTRKQKRHIKQY